MGNIFTLQKWESWITWQLHACLTTITLLLQKDYGMQGLPNRPLHAVKTGLRNVSEVVPNREVHTVGIIGFIVEIGAPAMQVFYSELHVTGYIIEINNS